MSFKNEPKNEFFPDNMIKKCERCGKEFNNADETLCLDCAMTEEDGIFFERDMGFGDR